MLQWIEGADAVERARIQQPELEGWKTGGGKRAGRRARDKEAKGVRTKNQPAEFKHEKLSFGAFVI